MRRTAQFAGVEGPPRRAGGFKISQSAHVSQLLLLNKLDLLGHLDFDLARFRANAARVNPALPVIELSARTGEGFQAWVDWLAREVAANPTRRAPCGEI